MTKLLAIAALLLATTAAAEAQYSFDYGGRTIRVDPDRGTVSIPGVYDNTGEPPRRARRESTERKRKPAPAQEAKSDPQGAPATSSAPAAAPPQTAVPAAPPPANTTVAVTPPAETEATTPPPAPPVQQLDAAPPPAPAPTVAAVPPAPAPRPAANPALANSPVGTWLTEEKDGKVRIQQCGANLCGYAVDKKTSQNREQILINMKPAGAKWSGRIHDPNSGSNYDSTIAMKGPNAMRVQGCAFGGMFCGGQTWKRVS